MRPGKIKTNNWATPQYIFDHYNKVYHFELDAAADSTNTKCSLFYDEESDGLSQPWNFNTWVNPPYFQIAKWVEKARNESIAHGIIVCMLLPAGTDTKWFADCMQYAAKIEFLTGRLKFGEALGSAMSPSIIVVFHGINADSGPVIRCVKINE